MRRAAMRKLMEWKAHPGRKPLLVRGARQVGKTWLMKAFGSEAFERTAYINFDNNVAMRAVLEGDYDLRRLLGAFQIESGVHIEPGKTLIILDEIQEAPRALTALKYFCEQAPEYAMVAAGSLLGVATHQGSGFPVGKVMFLDLEPMSFTEFLLASGNDALVEVLQARDWTLLGTLREKYRTLFRYYCFIGGMPEAVAAYVQTGDLTEVRAIQLRLLTAYEQDFSKHAPPLVVPRIRMVWQAIPAQLARENRKFLYGSLRDGARAKDFEMAIQWLCDAGLVHRVERVEKPDLPLAAYPRGGFKLFLADVGLLAAQSGLEVRTLLEGSRIFTEFKGALAEQVVQQQLRAESGIRPHYWSAERGDAEVDFLFEHDMRVVPVEVKAAENLKSKSLAAFRAKFQPPVSVRLSMSDFRRESWMVNLPLYAISQLLPVLEQR